MTIVTLGAPSLTGKDANQLVAEAFAGAKYPLTITVQNHMPRDVVFPEVEGLHLRHVSHPSESRKTVVIGSADLFQRLASSVEQVAELNRYQSAVTISSEGEAIPVDEAVDEPAATAGKPSDGLTYEQLKAALTAKGIPFQANAKKVDLAALLDAATEKDGADASNGSPVGA